MQDNEQSTSSESLQKKLQPILNKMKTAVSHIMRNGLLVRRSDQPNQWLLRYRERDPKTGKQRQRSIYVGVDEQVVAAVRELLFRIKQRRRLRRLAADLCVLKAQSHGFSKRTQREVRKRAWAATKSYDWLLYIALSPETFLTLHCQDLRRRPGRPLKHQL